VSELLQRQQKFVQLLAKLIEYVYLSPRWRMTFGDERAHHMPNSLHYSGLAKDLNLFVDGQYIQGNDVAWDSISRYWKSLDPSCRWGGDIAEGPSAGDFNHFSYAASDTDDRI
jgi:hypothetical protein